MSKPFLVKVELEKLPPDSIIKYTVKFTLPTQGRDFEAYATLVDNIIGQQEARVIHLETTGEKDGTRRTMYGFKTVDEYRRLLAAVEQGFPNIKFDKPKQALIEEAQTVSRTAAKG